MKEIKKEIKIVVMGSEDVGKTTLMENFIGHIGKVEHNGTTVAIDYGNIIINGKKLHLFGTPGQERFEFMRELTLNGVDYVLLVLDATTGLKNLDKKIIDKLCSKKIPYVIFINKTDGATEKELEKLKKEIEILCNNYCYIIEGSALNNKGFDELKNVLANLDA
ncbi:GTP-binding protein [Methanothermococcus okinawensis]|uniref:Small GTP-binding protein n=1 Tax=Methanothermococcus okinawensis (strain DSM 14208 / JCM 11175 / IH1) TaxID=647113 RepID=F8AKY7_METOI|nr:GTP-binding protein [Methanothermococcus okinawensis]AEH06395.1 small GTP-binding protein [Methanothermococcus okinawensis IH1]